MNGKNKLRMEDVVTPGNAKQSADVADTEMSMEGVRAESAVQRLVTKPQTLEIFGWKGVGIWAIVAIVIISAGAVIIKLIG
jgi:hypothetical protein